MTTKEQIKEEFEKHSKNDWCHFEGDGNWDEVNVYLEEHPYYEEIWNFISQSLDKQKEEIIGEVRNMKVGKQEIVNLANQGFGSEANDCRDRNEMIEDIIELL